MPPSLTAILAESGRWGDVPTWIASLTGLFALIFAAVAALFARRTFQVESHRDQVNERERRSQHEFARRVQAGLVSAWWGGPDEAHGIHVRNASPTPVYQAHVVAHKADDPDGGVKLDLPVVAPSEQPLFLPMPDLPDQRIVMTFTDSDGVRWRRDEYGRLRELPPRLSFWGDRFLGTTLERFKADFLASYGVEVTFQTDRWRDRQDGFVRAAQAGRIADVLNAPNDWIGNLVRHDVIEPVLLSARQRATIRPEALAAMTYQGRLYGVPLYLFTTALIRNTDLVPDPPATFDQLLEIGIRLRDAGTVSHPLATAVSRYGDPFKLSTVYSSLGGRVFDRLPDGGPDLSRLLVAEAASLAALARIRELGAAGLGVLRTEVDGPEAMRLFCQGQAPFLIESVLAEPRAYGIRCAVSPVPPFAGAGPATPWAIVTGLFVTRKGPNVAIARDLVADYLARADVVRAVAGQLHTLSASRLVQPEDAGLHGFADAFARSELMPAHPDIGTVWARLGELQAAVIAGADPVPAARAMAARHAAEFGT